MSKKYDQWVDLNEVPKQKTQTKKVPFKLILLILILVVVIGGGYLVYDKFISTISFKNNAKVNNDENKKNNTDQTKDDNNDKEDEKKTISKKKYIKDAEYQSEGLKESYFYYKEKMSPSDIVVPYLNLETESAKEFNKEIKDLYREFIEMYISFSNEGLSLKINETESYNYIKTNYTYTQENNIISILIKVNRTSRGSSEVVEYYSFNYDIKKDKILSFEDLCDKLNISYEDAIKKSNKILEITFNQQFELSNTPTDKEQKEIQEYINLNKEYFKTQIDNKTIQGFIDKNNKLKIILYNEHPFGGSGFYEEIVTINE